MSLKHEPSSEQGAQRVVLYEEVKLRKVRPLQPLDINVLWYRCGLVFKAHRLLYHSA